METFNAFYLKAKRDIKTDETITIISTGSGFWKSEDIEFIPKPKIKIIPFLIQIYYQNANLKSNRFKTNKSL